MECEAADEEFEDLFSGVESVTNSSQKSTTYSSADSLFDIEANERIPFHPGDTPSSSSPFNSHDYKLDSCDIAAAGGAADIEGAHSLVKNHPLQAKVYPLKRERKESKFDQSSNETPLEGDVMTKVEKIFEAMLDSLLDQSSEMAVTLRTRHKQHDEEDVMHNARSYRTRRLAFPGRSENEAWRFTVVMNILGVIHEALSANVVLSKRDVFYRDPALFVNQRYVDRYVDDIALTLGVSRSALNITAAAKGLIVGAVTFCRRDGSIIDAAADREGILVPDLAELLSVDMRNVKWILVIEKEATFRSIASSNLWNIISTRGVLITGKGYPDLSTRAMLRFLSTASVRNGFKSPPVHGLADFDPDGIKILSVYQHGSAALAHETATHAVSQLKWAGLNSHYLTTAMADERMGQGLLSLTTRDRTKARRMLELEMRTSQEPSEDFNHRSRELQVMLMLNTKAELQLLDSIPNGMTMLLMTELCESFYDQL